MSNKRYDPGLGTENGTSNFNRNQKRNPSLTSEFDFCV